MSEPSDDDKPDDGGKVREKLDVPATRKQEAVTEPPPRPSQSNLELEGPLTYPDDGPVSRTVRLVDKYIGLGEQVLLVALLVGMILVCVADALLDKLASDHLEQKDHVIEFATFSIAMIGAAFATQQSRHLAMDLVSKRLVPRSRLVLKVMLSIFTIFIVAIIVRAGMHNLELQSGFSYIVAWMIPIGGGLVILHTLLHIVIDIDYLQRGKTPPERMRSGH